jgi:hypothetical protein
MLKRLPVSIASWPTPRLLFSRPAALTLLLLLALLLTLSDGVSTHAWTPPAALNTNAAADSGNDFQPQVATDGAGNWVAVWYSYEDLGGTIGTDSDILVSRSADNGVTWTAPAALNTNAPSDSGVDSRPQVTTDGAGNWVAVWNSRDDMGGTIGTDYDILMSRSTDNGATWTAPAALNSNAATDSQGDENPQVTTDAGANWVAVWQSNENLGGTIGTDADILVARSTDSGATWTDPAALNTNAATDSHWDKYAQVTTDGAGNWVAVWHSADDLGGTIGTDDDILVARSTDAGATWTAPAALNTNANADSGNDLAPQVATDGGGNWLAVWQSSENLGGTIGTDLDILVARSVDNGATWSAPAALNANAATDSGWDGYAQVTMDGAGSCVSVWYSSDSLGGTIGGDQDILVGRSIDNGLTWTGPFPLNTNAPTDSGGDRNPQVTTHSGGDWLAVWQSTENLGGTIGTDADILYATDIPCSPDDFDCDTVPDGEDADPLDPHVCQDLDADTCDDCSVLGVAAPSSDGTDTDADGLCDAGDPDDDNDTVLDGDDTDPLDQYVCQDLDSDTCDDCSVLGLPDPSNDGPDGDGDGLCDAVDPVGVITGLDMDPTGNTATSLGTIDRCADALPEDVVEFDVWIDELEDGPLGSDESILTSQYDLGGWPASGTDGIPPQITAANHVLFLDAAPGSSIVDLSEAVPDGDDPYAANITDSGTAEYVSAGFTEGVTGRYTLDTTGAAAGLYGLTLSNVVHTRDDPPGGQVPNQAIWDSNYSDAGGLYGLVAIAPTTCPSPGADVKKLSLSASGLPIGNQAVQSITYWFTLTGTLHNNGPDTPVDVEDVTAIAVPAGIQISFHVSNANQTITIDGAPMNCTAPGAGGISCSNDVVNGVAPVSTKVAVNGNVAPSGTVLDVHETLTLPESVQTDVHQDWDFHCLDTGSYSVGLSFTNTVNVLPPSFDYDPTNNSGSEFFVINCLGAEPIDVKILDQVVTDAPPAKPPLPFPTLIVEQHDNVDILKTLHHNGVWLQAPADLTTGVILAYTGSGDYGQCVVTPPGVADQVTLDLSVSQYYPESFDIVCGHGGINIDDDGDGAIDEDPVDGAGVDDDGDDAIDEDSPYYLVTVTITNELTVKPGYYDPDPGNNVADSSVSLAVVLGSHFVGGVAEYPHLAETSAGESSLAGERSGSSAARDHIPLAGGLAAALIAAAAAAWYASRRPHGP